MHCKKLQHIRDI